MDLSSCWVHDDRRQGAIEVSGDQAAARIKVEIPLSGLG
jgi:hypothetical protein